MQKKGAGLIQKHTSTTSSPARKVCALAVAGVALLLGTRAQAQGILTVTPGRTAATTAGTGALGYTGDNSAATSAALAHPAAVAFDASGNLFLADANNHVIREVLAASGNIITVAGTGIAGFSGDGGPATAALLDTPTGIALDAAGNLYIADSHNQRIRKITGTTITTIAGTGSAGYAGDNGAATSAALNLPSALAVDASGNVYIADTNNQRIRRITGTTITTIAGTGEQNFTGDGGAATAATLDSPSGVAVDASGNVYIADRHNQRIREISAGNISTVSGSGTPDFAGSFSGDGSAAAVATLARPTGVAIDKAGRVYIADTNNQRVRELGGGAITTVLGTGEQGFAGDGGPAVSAVLNAPSAAAADSLGNLAVAEPPDQRIRSALLPVVDFGNQTVGVPSMSQTFALSNSGAASLTVSSVTLTGSFAESSGGSCSNPPITIAASGSCTVKVLFLPPSSGTTSGSVVFSGTGIVPQTILLTGNGVQAPPSKVVFTAVPPSPITAGGNAGTVQVALEDASSNVATANSGTSVSLNVAGPSGYTETYSAMTTNGVATFDLSSVPLTVAGAYTYTASSNGLTSAISMETVTPGTGVVFSVTGLGNFSAPGATGTATVTARDSYGNTATGFTGTVTFSSSDPSAMLPASYTYVAGDNGTHNFSVTLNTAGTQTVTATSGPIAGSEVGIVVEDAIWLINRNGTLARLSDSGTQTNTAGSAGSPSATAAIAFDHNGDVWTVSSATSQVSEYSNVGVPITVPGATSAGVNAPVALAIDGLGFVWIANGNGTVSVLTPTGAAVTSGTGYEGGSMNAPTGIVIDSSGSVWLTNSGNNSVTKIIGGAAPVVAPTVTGTTNNQLGTRP